MLELAVTSCLAYLKPTFALNQFNNVTHLHQPQRLRCLASTSRPAETLHGALAMKITTSAILAQEGRADHQVEVGPVVRQVPAVRR